MIDLGKYFGLVKHVTSVHEVKQALQESGILQNTHRSDTK